MKEKRNESARRHSLDQLQIAQRKGLELEEIAKSISRQFLLVTALETESKNLQDYMHSYGIANEYRKPIEILSRNFKNYKEKIIPLIDDKNKMRYFKDYDGLSELLESFIGAIGVEAK